MQDDLILICKKLGWLLPKLRRIMGYSQTTLCKRLHISIKTLRKLEYQKGITRLSTLISIIQFFALDKRTLRILFKEGVFGMPFVNKIGYTPELVQTMLNLDIGD